MTTSLSAHRSSSHAGRTGRRTGMGFESLEQRILFSAPTTWASSGVGGGGAFFSPSFNPANSSDLYVATDMGLLYHSTNLGQSWTSPPTTQIEGGRLAKVQYTNNASIQYCLDTNSESDVGTPSHTTNAGSTWTDISAWTTQVGNSCYSVSADPNSSTRLIASDYSNLYFSSNSGTTWTKVYTGSPSSGLYVGGVFWDPNETNIYVGTSAGLITSTNSGSTFALSSVTGIGTGEAIHSFAGAKSGSTTVLYALTWNSGDVYPGMFEESTPTSFKNIYKLTVGGTSWTPEKGSLTDYAYWVATNPADINTVYLSGTDSTTSYPTVDKSTNSGSTWSDVFLTTNNQNIATGWQGSGGDKNWTFAQESLGLAVAPNNSNVIATTDFGYVHVSSNGGTSWQQAYESPSDQNPAGSPTPQHKAYHPVGLEDTAAWAINWSDANDMMAGYTDVTGWRSANAGSSWSFPNYGSYGQNTIYQITQASSGTLYAASSTIHDLYQSTRVKDSTIDSGSGEVLYSTDKGADWSLLHNFSHPVTYTAIDPTNSNRMYAAVVNSTSGGIYVTNNLNLGASATWTKVTNPPRTQGHPDNIKVLNDGTLVVTYSARYATTGTVGFTASSGVFKSSNQGSTWTDVSAAGEDYWSKDITIDPTDSTQNTWYVAVENGYGGHGNGLGGLYRTTNRGTSWTEIYSSDSVESCTVNATTGEMYMSTIDNGLLYSANPRATTPTFSTTDFPFFHPDRIFINPFSTSQIWVSSFGWGLSYGTAGALAKVQSQPAVNNQVFNTTNPINDTSGIASNKRIADLILNA